MTHQTVQGYLSATNDPKATGSYSEPKVIREPQIVQELDNGENAIIALVEAVNRLENRLEPVLNQIITDDNGGSKPDQQFTPLAARINHANDNVFGAARRINGLIDRLEI